MFKTLVIMAFPTLLPTPTILKSLIEKVNDSQILADHAHNSFAVNPRGFTKGLSQTYLSFPSGQQTELRRSGACSMGRTQARLWRPVCIRSQAILTNTQHMSYWGAVGILSGGLLECWLPSNKILILSNSKS